MSHSDDGHPLPPPHHPPPSAPLQSPVPDPTPIRHSHARPVAAVAAIVAVLAGTAVAYSSRSNDRNVASTAVTTAVAPPSTTTIVRFTTTTEPAPTTVTVDVAAAACEELAGILGRVGSPQPTASALGDHLSTIADDLIDAATNLPDGPRSEARSLGVDIADLAATIDDLATAQTTGDPALADVIDAIVAATPAFATAFVAGSTLEEAYPLLQDECDFDDPDADEQLTSLLIMAKTLEAFMATPLASEPQFWLLSNLYAGTQEIVELLSRGARSQFHVDYAICSIDLDAYQLGDNVGCDALAFACNAGDVDACDDLYDISAVGSEYEQIGGTRGGREPLAVHGNVIIGSSYSSQRDAWPAITRAQP